MFEVYSPILFEISNIYGLKILPYMNYFSLFNTVTKCKCMLRLRDLCKLDE